MDSVHEEIQLVTWAEPYIHDFYARHIRPRIRQEIHQQRLKLIWWGWGYLPLLSLPSLGFTSRLAILARFLKIDWNIPHCHTPAEIVAIFRGLAERPGRTGEVLLEAGCWMGGSSAKFSIICKALGYRLCIYDSFEGVETATVEEGIGNYDFSGEYASPQAVLAENLERFGEPEICSIHKGWFKDTMAVVPYPIRVAYIDCDLAKGTREVLSGVVPALVDDGWIYSQDFHLLPVQQLLADPATWAAAGKGMPVIRRLVHNLASIRFIDAAGGRGR